MAEPGQKWLWKISLTLICAVLGGILTLWLAGVL